MRLLVFGTSGFLGRHVRRQAEAAGVAVVTAGRGELPGSAAHVQADLARDHPASLAGVIARVAPDAVANCTGATTGDPDALAAANVTGAYALATAILQAETEARLVHLGSAAEYGPGRPGAPVDESWPPRPVTAYGATKLAGTRLLQLARAAGLNAVVLRVFNPLGAGAPGSSLPGRVAAEFRRALGGGGGVRLGSLDSVRDFVDARDVADAVLAAAAAPRVPHAVLNIGSGVGITGRALVVELMAISGYAGPVSEDAPGSPRSAARSWQQADIRRARADLGWRPRRDLTESLADLWEASHA